mmetsp:Transcript_46055/g.98201  ORF Transcript_46055/g.98201 Transcript_46055/m.98201 type:complete len:118 (-) Transcript_46055:16-369(-)
MRHTGEVVPRQHTSQQIQAHHHAAHRGTTQKEIPTQQKKSLNMLDWQNLVLQPIGGACNAFFCPFFCPFFAPVFGLIFCACPFAWPFTCFFEYPFFCPFFNFFLGRASLSRHSSRML